MIQTKEKVICDQKYMVTQFPARRALKLKTRLVKLIAPSAFAAATSAGGGSILDADLNSGGITKAIESLVSRLDENDFVNLVLEMLSCTRRGGKEITESLFDMEYAGNFDELYKALLFVIEVNYGSFFRGIGIGNLSTKLQAAPQE